MMSRAMVTVALGKKTGDSRSVDGYVMIMGVIFGVVALSAVPSGITVRWITGQGRKVMDAKRDRSSSRRPVDE
jgi:hypothetical protein